MTIKDDLNYGLKDILDEDSLSSKKVKVRITTFIDEDILLMLKDHAKKSGNRYQTILNLLLRSFFDGRAESNKVKELTEAKVRSIVRDELKKKA